MGERVRTTATVSDLAVGLVSGYVGTKVMEPVSMKLYELESEADRQQENRVRPGPPYQIAAERATRLFGLQLTDRQLETAGMVFHYVRPGDELGSGVHAAAADDPDQPGGGWAAHWRGHVLVDEGLTPPPWLQRSQPRLSAGDAHSRLPRTPAYWLGVAATAEGLYFVGGTSEGR